MREPPGRARLALDNFGTGYCSLAHLKNLPISTLELDRCFVQNIASDERCRSLVGGMIQLPDRLGLTVVAEGVEAREQLELLLGEGCGLLQGYLFGAALAPEQFLCSTRRAPWASGELTSKLLSRPVPRARGRAAPAPRSRALSCPLCRPAAQKHAARRSAIQPAGELMSYLEDPRVFFAAERTLLAWQRSSIALIGLGLIVQRFGLLLQLEYRAQLPVVHTRMSAGITVLFLVAGALAALVSSWQYQRFLRQLGPSEVPRGQLTWAGPAMNYLLASAALAMSVWFAFFE